VPPIGLERERGLSAENLVHVIDQAVFVDHAAGARVFSDMVLLKIDRFG